MSLPAPSPLETVVLSSGDTTAYLSPERGGMATRFFVSGRPVFYLDEATLTDRTKNVRGGNPVLFPSPGRLASDRFTRDGKQGALGQHGFARNEPWEVISRRDAAATLRLRANDRTRAGFPWDFVATLDYEVCESTLRIVARFTAEKDASLPFAFGYHPYFHVSAAEKARASVPTKATRGWDNVAKRDVAVSAIDLAEGETDLHLYDHEASAAKLVRGDGHAVALRGSDAFRRWVVWTQPGKDFVCLEPWTAGFDALNTGDALLRVSAGETAELWLEIALEST